MPTSEKIILGIDPGSIIMGYGIIGIQNKKIRLIEMGVLKLGKYTNTAQRLKKIYTKVAELSNLYAPHACALEAPFFGKNIQSMLKLGRAQGVAMAAVMQAEIPVLEYSPKKIKQSITGNGNASKEQVWRTLQSILRFKEKPEYLDASDAVAVALCHYFQSQFSMQSEQKNDWSDFLRKNPHRIKKS